MHRTLTYTVGTLRAAGLEAKWGRTRWGKPALFAREPGDQHWWMVGATMWERARVVGVLAAFHESMITAKHFSVPA